ncbi:MAG: NB-ARC domain-containing protein [Aridibacter sp.]
MNDNNTICYQGIQRIFRNVIIDFIRVKMVEIYPDDYLDRLKKPFIKEWDKIKFYAEDIRKKGIIEAPIKDDFDILGVNNFYNLFQAEYDEFGIKPLITESLERKAQKQALLGWLKNITDNRNAISHPVEAEFTYDDTELLLLNALKVLKHLEFEKEVAQIQELRNQLRKKEFDIDENKDPLESELPPKESVVVEFIGRDEELELLEKWIKDTESRTWALAGDGGKGKSALAYNFAVNVKKNAFKPFDIVFWLSAKKRKFVAGEIVDITNPDFHDLESAIDKILQYYGFNEDINNKLDIKKTTVKELLEKFPAFIVIDDIDSLEGEELNANRFFSFDVAMTRSKVLFTSRRIIFGLEPITTTVKGFEGADAEDFIKSRCELMKLDYSSLNKKINKIIEVTDGSPLYIEDLLRWTLSQGNINKAIELWKNRGGDVAREYALQRECEALTDNALKVLFASCIFPEPITFDDIQKITEFNEEIVSASLRELQKLFLVSTPILLEDFLTFEVNLNIKMLVEACYKRNSKYNQVKHSYKSIYKDTNKPDNKEVGAVIRQAMLYIRNNEFELAKELIDKALNKYKNNPDLIGILGFIFKTWQPNKRITDARESFRRAAQLDSKKEDLFKHWCEMELDENEWENAIDVAKKGICVNPESKILHYYLAESYIRKGGNQQSSLFREKALKNFYQAREVLDSALKIRTKNNEDDSITVKIYKSLLNICNLTNDQKSIDYYLQKLNKERIHNIESLSDFQFISKRYASN